MPQRQQMEQNRYQVLPEPCPSQFSQYPGWALGWSCCISQGGELWHHWNVWQQGWVSKECVWQGWGWGRNSHLQRNLVGDRQRCILLPPSSEVRELSPLIKWKSQGSKRLNNLLNVIQLNKGGAGNLRLDSLPLKSGLPNYAHLFIHVTCVNCTLATCQVF